MIGIGLWDEKDITVKGLEAVKSCDKVYLESYTSKLGVDTKKLEDFYGKKIIKANRDLIENNAVEMYADMIAVQWIDPKCPNKNGFYHKSFF